MTRFRRRLLATAIALFAAQAAVAADAHKAAPEPASPPKAAPAEKDEHKDKADPKGETKPPAKPEATAEAKPAVKPEIKLVPTREGARVELIPRTRPVVAAPAPAPRRVSSDTRQRALAAVAAAKEDPHPAHPPHWSYEGPTGPEAWGKMSPEWAKCGNGERQSPIDIRDGLRVELEPIAFDYRPSSYKVVDNGHTIQVNVNGWNSLRIMGKSYRLVQFHFHRPSEEMVDGKSFEMVAHLVHQDNQGKLAVVAVLIEKGARQPVLQTVLNNIPLEKGQEVAVSSYTLDMAQMLPSDRRYFTYMGSLTTPPCTEDVLWIVMKQPAQATAEQLNLFARIYPMNARPVQEGKGRLIKESN